MAAPESINGLYHFPAWAVMVGQSIICATAMVSSTGGPCHSWGALLREGFFSLNHHQNHWMCHPNSSSQIGGHQW